MFKNHAFQIKMVNTKKNPETNAPNITDVYTVDPEQIAQTATDHTIKIIGAVGAVIAANKVLNTICEIAVIAAKAKLK